MEMHRKSLKENLLRFVEFGLVLTILIPSLASATVVKLPSPEYWWWYGCSPTAAGMLIGYYDREGYEGMEYNWLCPGGEAEAIGGTATPLARAMIASSGHVADYWGTPDPLASGRSLPDGWDCLADYMGTSQGSYGNGSTSWYVSGHDTQPGHGLGGIVSYIESRGYNTVYVDTRRDYTTNNGGSFSFANYKAEIDAGRPMILHVPGHSMYGYGYDDSDQSIYYYNTWQGWGERHDLWTETNMAGLGALNYVTRVHIGGGDPMAVLHGSAHVEHDSAPFTGSIGGTVISLDDLWHVYDVVTSNGFTTLAFYYDEAELLVADIQETSLKPYWNNSGVWQFDGLGDPFFSAPVDGLWNYGVDLDGNYAWINVSHASDWALGGLSIIPEPATIALLGLFVSMSWLFKRSRP